MPAGLAPDGTTVVSPSVTMTWSGVSGAASYEIAIERQVGATWTSYTTYTSTTPSKTFWPQSHGTSYRFHVRAIVANVPTAWSVWASFAFS